VALHLIPDENSPHAPTGQCGCTPRLAVVVLEDGSTRWAFKHWATGDDLAPILADDSVRG